MIKCKFKELCLVAEANQKIIARDEDQCYQSDLGGNEESDQTFVVSLECQLMTVVQLVKEVDRNAVVEAEGANRYPQVGSIERVVEYRKIIGPDADCKKKIGRDQQKQSRNNENFLHPSLQTIEIVTLYLQVLQAKFPLKTDECEQILLLQHPHYDEDEEKVDLKNLKHLIRCINQSFWVGELIPKVLFAAHEVNLQHKSLAAHLNCIDDEEKH